MKLFTCERCGNLLYFENVSCTRCGAQLGFFPEQLQMAAFDAIDAASGKLRTSNSSVRLCRNYAESSVCNWLVPADSGDEYCVACALNRTVPDLRVPENMGLWHTIEVEKRRLVYALLRLDLPLVPQSIDDAGLAFDFLADTAPQFNERGRVMTGHFNGLITLNIAEADPVERERMRGQMAEPYRTILGHFRHESGHYYWDRLVRDTHWLDECRTLFGDESADYGQSLEAHYNNGPPANWRDHYVSAYATMHPWEDWAETWAHYLHIVDTLETAFQFGLRIHSRAGDGEALNARPDFNAYHADDFVELTEHWFPLSFMLNSLNRSMGQEDAYPFTLPPPALAKLEFVHRVIREG